MGRTVTVAVSTLNQWAMDFDGNLKRILESIEKAKAAGAKFRSGPELEITGYNCEDHFWESDTNRHSWEVLAVLLKSPVCEDILIDVGMPVMHKNVTYNCRVAFLNRRILLIRPKMRMCDSSCYSESRWFSSWTKEKTVEDFFLPQQIAQITGQTAVPIGDAVISTRDTCIGFEICAELWNPDSSHIPLSLDGVEIISNASGSTFEIRKLHSIVEKVRCATAKAGGCYMLSDFFGSGGGRMCFIASSSITVNGSMIGKAKQFSLKEVEVTTATFDLDDIRSYRNAIRSRTHSAAASLPYPRVKVDFSLSLETDICQPTSPPIDVDFTEDEFAQVLSPKMLYLTPEEEVSMAPACWLWDYLRRSCQGGFFLPLSGGVDSSAVACIVYSMCQMVVEEIGKGDAQVLADVQKIVGDCEYVPNDPKQLCNTLLITCYMGTENSSAETKVNAAELASQIGSYHLSIVIDSAVSAMLTLFQQVTKMTPKFKVQGGSPRENLALQNVQGRIRMVTAYLFAQLMLWVRGRPGGLLVLGSSNMDQALRGYFTKYDCSSADINPIGSISRQDLERFLKYFGDKYGITVLKKILDPTAEMQRDEIDMGMTYKELSTYGKIRIHQCSGPFSMFCKLIPMWSHFTPTEVADKVKHFYRCYAINRHKMTILTPSCHLETYSPDDNRSDLRPFLYNHTWKWQFDAIDNQVQQLHDKEKGPKNKSEPPRVPTKPRISSQSAVSSASDKTLPGVVV